MKGKKRLWRRALAGIGIGTLLSGAFFYAHNEWEMEKVREERMMELEEADGKYDQNTIVLEDTTHEEAAELAEKLGAEVRLTEDGGYAALYLPEELTIEDVYHSEKYETYLSEMSPDYMVSLAAMDANKNPLHHRRPQYEVNDKNYGNQEYLDYVNMQDSWEKTRGAGVTVAVIDTGIDTDHEEFDGRISTKSYNASEDKVVADYGMDIIEDEAGHGTAVAGVLASSMNNGVGITGIAPEVELLVIKCEADETGEFVNSSDLVFGLAYAIERDVDVINMSFGTECNSYARYTKLAVDSDIICIAAAGNESSGLPVYPAADENVIGVGSMELESWSLAEYSNFGDNSDVLAPGTVFTTKNGGGYGYETGTSMSAPVVAGAVALYLAEHPYMEFTDIFELIKASSTDLGTLGEDWYYGYGALDVNAFLYENKGTITYEMLTDEVDNLSQTFVQGHTIQYMPEPERENVVFDGWYYDMECTVECEYYTERFTNDVTLYASWINEDEGSAYIYSILEDGTVEIQSYTGKRRYLTVPAEIEGRKVSKIGADAFNGNSRIRSVTLPADIVTIGDRAFVNCTSLRDIVIPDKVISIGEYAFNGCVRLSLVSTAAKGALRSIGTEAFAMSGIGSFNISANVKDIGDRVFYGSTAMTSVTVTSGNAVYQIKNGALYNSSGDTLLYYPAGKTGNYTVVSGTGRIEDDAFAYTRSTQVVLPEGLNTIGEGAFANSNIKKIAFPDSLTVLEDNVCFYAQNLSEVDLGKGSYALIPQGAFEGCYQLKAISIPILISKIEAMAFAGTNIKNVQFEKNSIIEMIGTGAFMYCPLERIEIPDNVSEIGASAFAYCPMLSEVVFGENSKCEFIGEMVFINASSLKYIMLPDAVTTVGVQAFYGSGLQKLEIGGGLTEIGEGAFSACQELFSIDVNSGNTVFASKDGVLFDKHMTELLMYPAAKTGSYTVPSTVTSIAMYAFAEAGSLSDVTLNEGLTEIGGYAFSGCSILQTPVLPSSLVAIGENAFEYCAGMTNGMLIPKKVKSIGRYAFYNDYNLTSIRIEAESELSRIGYGTFAYCGITDFTVPGNISSMGQEVFTGCNSLIAVTFEADSKLEGLAAWVFQGAEELRRVTFEEGSSLAVIEARAFEGVPKLDEVNLLNCTKLTKIGNYAFTKCGSLQNIMLPSSLEEIGRYAFHGCGKLSSITVPSAVQFIGRYAFAGTKELNIYFKAPILPVTLEENWDYDVAGYYLGSSSKQTSGDLTYVLTEDGRASIVAYTGSAAELVLDKVDGYEIVSIGGGAFKNNTVLKKITLPDTLAGIYQAAFAGTTALESISIPASVTAIDAEAFRGSGVQKVTFEAGSALKILGQYAFAETKNLTGISVPDGVEKVRDYSFFRSGLQEITFGSGSQLTEIGRSAFAETALKSVDLPKKLHKIDFYAFTANSQLTAVSFGTETELQLMGNAFYDTGLTEVEIPANVRYIGELCFADCGELEGINVAAGNTNYSSVNGILFDKEQKKLITCPAGKTGSYEVPASVTTFAFAAFEGCKLSEIHMPADGHLITIGYRTFYKCNSLTSISIPDSVQSIENYAFAYCSNLETVTINEASQIGGIYKGAFYNCAKLKAIRIPDGVQEIDDYAFYGCSALTEVEISENSQLKGVYDHAFEYSGIREFVMPKGMLEIGEYAFRGTKLQNFVFNDVVTDLGAYALADAGLTGMTDLYIPDSVEYIGRGLLRGDDSIKNLSIPFIGEYLDDEENVRFNYIYGGSSVDLNKVEIRGGSFIGRQAFANWNNSLLINELVLPDTLKVIYDGAFGYTNLKSIVIPDGVTKLGDGILGYSAVEKVILPKYLKELGRTFENCEFLEEIVLPEGLKSIGESAFYNCSSLKGILVPKSVELIGKAAFSGCSNLEYIHVTEGNQYYCSVDEILYNIEKTEIISVPGKISGRVAIPEGITEIEYHVFAHCENITEIIFPESLKKIGGGAFAYCHGLSEVVVPGSITEVESQVFFSCNGLKHAVVEGDIKDLKSMFYDCTSLESVELPEGLEYVGSFQGCGFKSLILPETVKALDHSAFRYCYNLEYVYIGKELKNLGLDVFDACSDLRWIDVSEENSSYMTKDGILYNADATEILVVPKMVKGKVELPEGIKMIHSGALSYCTQMEEIVLPESVKEIGYGAFAWCNNLKKVTFGSKIESIGSHVLAGTPYIENKENQYDGIVYVGEYAVDYRGGTQDTIYVKNGTRLLADAILMYHPMKYIHLPSSVEYIGIQAFEGCINLKAVSGGAGVKEISSDAFWSCSSLASVCFPRIEMIADSAFSGCLNLKYVDFGNSVAKKMQEALVTNGTIETLRMSPCEESFWLVSRDMIWKNIVIEDCFNLTSNYFWNVSGTSFFVREKKEANILPEGWNNGNKVYYCGEWNLASFYVDGKLLMMEPIPSASILQVPAENMVLEYLPSGSVFSGWDITGDGIPDKLPATLTGDIRADAVVNIPLTSISIAEYETMLTPYMETGDCKTLHVNCTPIFYNEITEFVWSSSDVTIASVDENGVVTANSVGDAVITVQVKDQPEIQAECPICVGALSYGMKLTEDHGEMNAGETKKLEVKIVLPEDFTDPVVWSSSDETVATVADGVITAIAPGTTWITVSAGPYQADYYLTVLLPMESADLEATEHTMNVDETFEMKINFVPANTTDSKNIIWTSMKPSVAIVDEDGIVTAKSAGTTTVSAIIGDLKLSCEITVKAPLKWIKLNTNVGTMRLERTKPLEVIYEPADTTDDKSVVWSSADPEIASVDRDGVVTAHKAGTTVITGTVGNLSDTYEVTVVGIRHSGTGIIVVNSDDTPMKDGIELEAVKHGNGHIDDHYRDILKRIDKEEHPEEGKIRHWDVYEIYLHENGTVSQPEKGVDVEFPLSEMIENGAVIYFIAEDGSYVNMNALYKDGKLTFATDHFSTYAVGAPVECMHEDVMQHEVRNASEPSYETNGYTGDTYCLLCESMISTGTEIPAWKYVTEIAVNPSEITLELNGTCQISVQVYPEDAHNKGFIFRSTDESIAAVDESGNVTALQEGTAEILAEAQDGSGVSGMCRVTVHCSHSDAGRHEIRGAKEATYEEAGYTGDTYCLICGTMINAGTEIPQLVINEFEVRYDANGGSKEPASQIKKRDQVLALSSEIPERKGYQFLGWAEAAGASEPLYAAGGSYKKNEEITLYAVWKANTYTIKYYSNGGEGKMSASSATYGKSRTLRANTFTRKGYTFVGWNTKKDGSGSSYADQQKVKRLTSKNNGTAKLYAQWELTSYKITYELNKGTNSDKNPAGYTIKSDTIKLSSPSRKGYSFKGWYTSEEFKTKVTEIKAGSTGEITLYAKWSANKYKIKYHANGGSGKMSATSATYGKSVTLRGNEFKRSEYVFTGWNTKKDGSGTSYDNKEKVKNLTSKKDGEKTLYAQWKRKEYTVTYKLNKGTNSDKNPSVYTSVTADIKLEKATRKGYTFKGWYTDSKYKNRIKTIECGDKKDLTLYAKWEANNYKISYNSNGGSGKMSSTSATYGKSVRLRANTFTKEGYVFGGWNTKKDGSGKSYGDEEKVKNLKSTDDSKITLYAQWLTPLDSLEEVTVDEVISAETVPTETSPAIPSVKIYKVEAEDIFGDGAAVETLDEEVSEVSENPENVHDTVEEIAELCMLPGEKLQLGIAMDTKDAVLPEGIILTWRSSDESIVSVAQDGTVTAENTGEVVLQVLLEEVVLAECKVIVGAQINTEMDDLFAAGMEEVPTIQEPDLFTAY